MTQYLIRFGLAETSIGLVLVAASARGVCAVFLGDTPERLTQELYERFVGASFFPAAADDAKFVEMLDGVIKLIEDPSMSFNHPIDINGTDFQLRVWQALREIPLGKTVSYLQVARRIGAPRSSRPVANACGDNPLAVIIPCHRVTRNDGSLSGYRWGVERKRTLLIREGVWQLER